MTCMDRHDTSLPLHLIIPNASILPHQVSLVMLSLSTHSTPFLPHEPWVIPQSPITILGAHPSPQQRPCVPCSNCGHLYIIGVGLTHH
jgi:hypothetical protein